MRIAVGIEYDGSAYAGWQCQSGRPSIQAVVEMAVSRVADEPVKVVCAGRTDAGVHALEQVVHFDTEVMRSPYSWVMGCNSNLPLDVRVVWARETSDDFHARCSAIARYYRYVILNRPVKSALRRQQVTWCHHDLDVETMMLASACLIGEHDFTSFRAQGCQSRSPNRFMHFINVERIDDLVYVDLCANAFLHHMVRNIVGNLLEIGAGKRSSEWMAELLALRDRKLGAATAPPDGLYLAGICYPESFGLVRHSIFKHLPSNARRYQPVAARQNDVHQP
jgi:tRNA pseudouridine38-40 synthase